MKLRDDPVASSAMAGVLTQSNSFQLTGQIGRRPTDGELYMAHFMGVGGAAKLINNAEDNPKASAAWLFPNAAAANRSIFYDRQGSARSVSEVYSVLTSRYAGAANSQATQTALAMYGNTAPATAVASAAALCVIDRQRRLSLDLSECRRRSPSQSHPTRRRSATLHRASRYSARCFRSTISPNRSRRQFAPCGATPPRWRRLQAPTATSQATNGGAPQPLDLFSDRNGTFSS